MRLEYPHRDLFLRTQGTTHVTQDVDLDLLEVDGCRRLTTLDRCRQTRGRRRVDTKLANRRGADKKRGVPTGGSGPVLPLVIVLRVVLLDQQVPMEWAFMSPYRLKERLGGLDVLVNNAATNPYAGPTIDVDLARWQKTLEINLTAPLLWTQRAWQRAMKEHGGAVVNISSVGGFSTSPILGVYDITKAALIHLTKQLAAELGPQVRVNAIAPGLIKTDFARALWDGGGGDLVAKAYPLKRLGEPEDVAEAARYLASDASSWGTGQTLVLDGGGIIAFQRTG